MSIQTRTNPSQPQMHRNLLIVIRVVTVLGFIALWAAILFICAGRLDWDRGWWFIGAYMACIVVGGPLLLRNNPDVIAERAQIKADSKTWDRVIIAGGTTIGLFGMMIVAGLDERFGWSQPMPAWIAVVGMLLIVAGGAFTMWAMAQNKFFALTVRIQNERGHYVVSSGPYAFVRHPGYVGMILFYGAPPLVLDSAWALLPALLVIVLLLIRTVLEDRTLQRELAGYREYAQRVKYRLLPGVW